MKKTALFLFGIIMILTASAQFSAGVNANYTMYRGLFQKSTVGTQLRASYTFNEKTAAVLSFNYGLPIKQESMVTLQDSYGSTSQVPSEIKYKFRTINLLGHYSFVGGDEAAGKLYGITGIGIVIVSYDETVKENYDKNAYTPMDQVNGKENGFTINLGLGGEYKIGAPSVFAEAGLALPANQANGQYIENPIPSHFIFNVGVKFNFGGGE